MPSLTLDQIRDVVRSEAGMSLTAAHQAQSDTVLRHRINTAQRELALEFQFPELHLEMDVAITASDNTYSFPANLGFQETMEVWCSFGSEWTPVSYGVGLSEQSAYSATTEGWPILKWEPRVATDSSTLTITVWPTPSQAGTLRFSGQKAVTDMSGDSDPSTLDGTMIGLFCAGLILAKQGAKDAELMLSRARRRGEDIVRRQLSTMAGPNLASRGRRSGRPYIDYIPPSS